MASRVNLKLLRQPNENDKLAPQMKAIVKTLTAMKANEKEVNRQDVVERLEKDGELKTRQSPDRILAYYQPRLKELGIIQITKVEGEKKPAKEKGEGKGGAAKAKSGAAGPIAGNKAPSAAS